MLCYWLQKFRTISEGNKSVLKFERPSQPSKCQATEQGHHLVSSGYYLTNLKWNLKTIRS